MSNNPYYDQDTQFITGFAGSGKSTLLATMTDSKTLVLVPTHKAADVLIAKGVENVYTIHAVLKLVPSINDNFRKKMHTKLKQVGKTDLSTIKNVIIDEFSMINLEILDTLMAVLPSSAHVTISGDPFQLPPITGQAIEPWEPITELTTQHRSKNLEGTSMFMEFMYAISRYGSSPKYKFTRDEDWLEKFNPETDRVLAFTNATVTRLNNLISGGKEYVYNEPLLMNGLPCEMVTKDYSQRLYPSCISKGKLLDHDKLVVAAQKALNDIVKWKTNLGMYKETTVELDGTPYIIYFDPNHYQTEKRLKADVEKFQAMVIRENELSGDVHIPTWCKENRSRKGVKERGAAWSKYLVHTGYVFNLARPYATTVHKAQGSEFSTVFIAQQDIAKAATVEQYQRLMYVALSRAIDRIIFI